MSQDTASQPIGQVAQKPWVRNWKAFLGRLLSNKSAVFGGSLIIILAILAVIGPWIAPQGINEQDFALKLQGPTTEHWFGTDDFGRDVFSRILHGLSITFRIGFVSVAIAGTVGTVIGIISGYYGGKLDAIIMRIMDILLAFPSIILALAIVATLGPGLNNIILAVAISAFPVFARIARGSTLSVKKLEYIDAVKALGASDTRIIFKHILPNTMSPLIVQSTLSIATGVLSAAGLSFLGLGVSPPSPEWGAMLNSGKVYMFQAPHMTYAPGLAIVLFVLAFNLFGDGLRDALDPKTK
ncbi:ABC transporter permease [Shouchella clausii]|jgi:peptide/nickel transport system permease protein|uniref:Oligopeptide ABC transporter permease n=2 Tax=Shouchella clausii TaxID=79880 RepID=Q5WM00_SHOC1|nr:MULTISPECIES: ABC transporter permease [Shouchella]MCM3314958.1 ABC transporter permease [Psychrobacillus sp. MER TA 17]ALA52853.1 Dipeptide transport system permease protein DppC [Shouchella clausii]KKI84685.1 diguanylate cyclase [Shouchella clausii]MBU3233301.1 ABC transporter permease [Shouchella clausii]MBU3266229.1 ABC transporter permease [Shouchella clausii]